MTKVKGADLDNLFSSQEVRLCQAHTGLDGDQLLAMVFQLYVTVKARENFSHLVFETLNLGTFSDYKPA